MSGRDDVREASASSYFQILRPRPSIRLISLINNEFQNAADAKSSDGSESDNEKVFI